MWGWERGGGGGRWRRGWNVGWCLRFNPPPTHPQPSHPPPSPLPRPARLPDSPKDVTIRVSEVPTRDVLSSTSCTKTSPGNLCPLRRAHLVEWFTAQTHSTCPHAEKNLQIHCDSNNLYSRNWRTKKKKERKKKKKKKKKKKGKKERKKGLQVKGFAGGDRATEKLTFNWRKWRLRHWYCYA